MLEEKKKCVSLGCFILDHLGCFYLRLFYLVLLFDFHVHSFYMFYFSCPVMVIFLFSPFRFPPFLGPHFLILCLENKTRLHHLSQFIFPGVLLSSFTPFIVIVLIHLFSFLCFGFITPPPLHANFFAFFIHSRSWAIHGTINIPYSFHMTCSICDMGIHC